MSSSAWPSETSRIFSKLCKVAPLGIFSTGIENSDPFVEGKRRNELVEAYAFTKNYKERLKRINNLGIGWIRFGVGYSQVSVAPGIYDFELSDKVIKECENLNITVIADLLHFGLPEWIHQDSPEHPFFQNPKFPEVFAKYVKVFVKRYHHIKYFTPVNEPLVTAVFSARNAMWNEAKKGNTWEDDQLFITAIANIAKAAILAKQSIQEVWQEEGREDEPIFFQNDSFEKSIAMDPSREMEAERFNLARFAALDLIFGQEDQKMKALLLSQGLSEKEYEWFMKNGDKKQTVLGIDHYPLCVNFLYREGEVQRAKFYYGLEEVVREYWQRYQMPLLHMEVNSDEKALLICEETYKILKSLKNGGLPILGMAWFGDDVQIGWGNGLVGPKAYDEHCVGLFYKGEKQPVADLFSRYAHAGL